MTAFRQLVGALGAGLCAYCVAGAVLAQNYAWDRSTEYVSTNYTVAVQVQEGNYLSYNDSDPDFTGGPAVCGNAISDTQTVYGGGGGGGGDGADLNDNGADGQDGVPVDGANGQDDVGHGGKGGKAGSNGSAYGRAHADGQSQLNPDGQLSMSWTFIHNQDAQLTLLGAGGGGGGGEGGAAEQGGDRGGSGGGGGDGDDAQGNAISLQESSVDAVAELEFGPDADENTPEETIARAIVAIAWGRTGCEMENWGDDYDPEEKDEVWQRGVDVDISFGDAWLELSGGPAGPVTAYGETSEEEEFYKDSADHLEDASGTFEISQSEFWDCISVGDTASIQTGEDDVYSRIEGQMLRHGGQGGEGGNVNGGSDDGDDGDDGGGAAGGAGGQGGARGEEEADDGEDGGNGGDGGKVIAHEAGLFQGVIEIRVDN